MAKRGRSAITGRIVTVKYAKAHPKSCIVETYKPGKN
jgi:hypothetical protein